MHIAAIVAPAGRLGIEGLVDVVIETVPQSDHRCLTEQTVVGQHLLGAFHVAACKLRVAHQVMEDARGECLSVVLSDDILVDILHDDLAVPAEEAEALAVVAAPADGIPVVMVPVGIAAILVDEHIVDKRINVEQGVEFGVRGVVGGLGHRLHHLVPRRHVALAGLMVVAALLFNLHHVDVALLTAEMVFAVLVVHTLRDIIHAPVHAIDKEVHIEGVDTGVPHLALHAAGPDVTGVLCLLPVGLRPVLPRVAEMAAQHQLVELLRLSLAEERIIQTLHTVLFLEYQSERVLGVLLCQPPMTAMQTEPTGGGELRVERRVLSGGRRGKHLDADGACPAVARRVAHRGPGKDIDAAAVGVVLVTEQMVLVGDDAQHRQRLQAFSNLGAQRGVAGHLRVHLVVGHGRTADVGIFAPRVGVAGRCVALTQHIVDKQVGGRLNGGDQP